MHYAGHTGIKNQPDNSPCIRRCCLNDNDVCLGCFRTMKEIMAWSKTGEQERQNIITVAQTRKDAYHKRYPGAPIS